MNQTSHISQPYLDDSVELNARQRVLLKICDEYEIVIGHMATTSGEDIAVFFPTVHTTKAPGGGTVEEHQPAEEEISRFCAVTRHDDIYYANPNYDHQAGAESRAAEMLDDDIFDETPVAVYDLDLGDCWLPHYKITWLRPGEEPEQ